MTVIYPRTRTESSQDTLAGVSFHDPYRWLEQDSEEVRQWQHAQAQLASAHVREWPHFERLQALVAKFNTERAVTPPKYAAGRWFCTRTAAGATQAHVVVADEPMGEGHVVFDPRSENRDRPPFLSWFSPSPDGRILAVGVCDDGSERNSIRLVDVHTGELLADPPAEILMDSWSGGAHWLPDSSGFFFTASSGLARDIEQRVYLHLRSVTPTTELVNVPWTSVHGYRMVVVSRDGRHAVAMERMHEPIPVAIATLGEGPLHWRPFVTTVTGALPGHVVGDRYIAITDIGAPRGRLVAIPLDAKDPNDPARWQQLIGESSSVLRTVTPIAEVLYLTEFVDTYARVRVVDCDGRPLCDVPLPSRGAISEHSFPFSNLVPSGHPERFVFGFSSLTASWGIYSHTPGEQSIVVLRAPQVCMDGVMVEDLWARSRDGTPIPYHLVRRADIEVDRPLPTMIYGYGGFNLPLVPQFPGPMAAFVAAGGVFVHAHLRGGGEFGADWWQAGRFRHKQNSYQDVYAIAEHLIESKRCTPGTLAVTGRSNGGLMAGVALTQRPDLWAAVVPRVPRLDLIGACRTAYGRRATLQDRTTDIDDPEEVRRLATFSPYHLIRDGVCYPAVFIDAGDTDPRCPPQDARKFAAKLQRATAGSAPILVHVWENVGHGLATDRETAVIEHTEWLAFVLRHLGVRDWRA